ncbi:hypothetical protein GB851_07425 [Kingella kingae]|nr:hypothetical protein GB851_07425 [Kingella kingae]
MPTPLCTRCTRRSLSPCPNLNLIHYKFADFDVWFTKSAGCFFINNPHHACIFRTSLLITCG